MQTRRLIALIFFIFLSIAIALTRANATVVQKLSDEDKTVQAQAILIGTCTSIRSEWNEEGTKIFTYITISPQTVLKGDDIPEELVIKNLGGVVGDIGMHADGTSVFEEGEEVLLFLRRGTRGLHKVLGLSEGKFSVKTDPDTQRKVLVKKRVRWTRTLNGKIEKRIFDIKPDKKVFLDDFVERIQNILQEKGN